MKKVKLDKPGAHDAPPPAFRLLGSCPRSWNKELRIQEFTVKSERMIRLQVFRTDGKQWWPVKGEGMNLMPAEVPEVHAVFGSLLCDVELPRIDGESVDA